MNNWIIQQKWSELFFISYEVESELLKKSLPRGLEVDLFNGKAYVSIVPFIMSDIKFFLYSNFAFFKLNELNLRTYVTFIIIVQEFTFSRWTPTIV